MISSARNVISLRLLIGNCSLYRYTIFWATSNAKGSSFQLTGCLRVIVLTSRQLKLSPITACFSALFAWRKQSFCSTISWQLHVLLLHLRARFACFKRHGQTSWLRWVATECDTLRLRNVCAKFLHTLARTHIQRQTHRGPVPTPSKKQLSELNRQV